MATDKRRVAGYLDPLVDEAFRSWVRRMEVSESQALNIILAEHFNLSREVLNAGSVSNLRKIIREEIERYMGEAA